MKRLIGLLVLICLFTLPVLAATSSGCPSSGLTAFKVASNVSAYFTTSGTTDTYFFSSLTNEKPVNGVPGLVKYCVYPSAEPDKGIKALYDSWISKQDPHDFAFIRPGGNKTNIPLDGTQGVQVGTATWTALPNSQTILLHIADPTVCAGLYGGTPSTCFVKPSQACVAGDSNAAYNAIPTGAENCIPPSFGVEAYGFNELGDQVTFKSGTGRTLVSLNVLFTSYGCSASGHWYSGDCVTNAGDTFDVPITASIYESANCSGTPLVCLAPVATVTTTQTIPYRPSADPVNCGGPDPYGYAVGSRWFNPAGNGGAGACQYSIGKLLTFTFPAGTTLPDNVVWTVAYNTSHSGYHPIASPLGPGDACEASAGGCGYDSLNIGTKSYTGAPYAGTDVDESVIFLNWWAGNGVPQYPPPFGFGVLTPPAGVEATTDTINDTWIGLRPLGEIITK